MRKFKPAKASRSKRYRQLIIPVYFSAVKQIAIRQERTRRSRPAGLQFHKWSTASLVLVAAGLIGALFFSAQAISSAKPNKLEPVKQFSVAAKTTPAKPKYLSRSQPTHLTIASVGIDDNIIPVGKASDGTIQMPPLFDWVTGWYKYSPTPGQLGPAIIVGHVDTYKGISVFWRLRYVKPGDIISVKRQDGSTVKFKVDALKQFSQATATDDDGMVQTPGNINGGFFQKTSVDPLGQAPSVVVSVDDIKAAMADVEKAGGKILGGMTPEGERTMEPTMIPGVGLWISIQDTEGNRLSLLQPSR